MTTYERQMQALDRAAEAAVVADLGVPGKGKALDHMIARHPDPQEGIQRLLEGDLRREMRNGHGPVLFPHARKLMRDHLRIEAREAIAGTVAARTGMGQDKNEAPAKTGWLDVLNTLVDKTGDVLIKREQRRWGGVSLDLDFSQRGQDRQSGRESDADLTRGNYSSERGRGIKAGFLAGIPPWALVLGVAGIGAVVMVSGVLEGGSSRPRPRRRRR